MMNFCRFERVTNVTNKYPLPFILRWNFAVLVKFRYRAMYSGEKFPDIPMMIGLLSIQLLLIKYYVHF